MRSREKIENEFRKAIYCEPLSIEGRITKISEMFLEVLLDIRELLQDTHYNKREKENDVCKTAERD